MEVNGKEVRIADGGGGEAVEDPPKAKRCKFQVEDRVYVIYGDISLMERIQKACGLDLTETMKNCSGRIGMVEKVSSDASIADVSFYIFAPPLNGLPSRQESILSRVVCKWNSQALRILRTFHTCTGDKVAWIKGHNTTRPVMASVEVVNVKHEIYQMVVTKKRFPFNRDTFPTDVILPIYNGRKLEGVLRELPIPKTDFQAVDRLVFEPSMKTVFMRALDPREWCLPYDRHERSIRDPRKALGPFSPGGKPAEQSG